MKLVVIAGMPASGKSTFAAELGRVLRFPVLEKDAIKEELFDTLGFTCYAEKQRMDVAATAVLLRVADALLGGGMSVIAVNNFRDDAKADVQELVDRYALDCVTVFFGGDADVFYQRYVERDHMHLRHLGHVLQDRYPPLPGESHDYDMTREEFARKFEKLGMDAFQLTGPRIDVDATYPESKILLEVGLRAVGKYAVRAQRHALGG